MIKKIDPSLNSVIIDTSLGQAADGVIARYLNSQYQSITLQSNGSEWFVLNKYGLSTVTITDANSPYFATADDNTILIQANAGPVTVDLPSASTCAGRVYTFKRLDASANAVTIDTSGGQTIEGVLTHTLPLQYDTVTIQSNGGTEWFIIN